MAVVLTDDIKGKFVNLGMKDKCIKDIEFGAVSLDVVKAVANVAERLVSKNYSLPGTNYSLFVDLVHIATRGKSPEVIRLVAQELDVLMYPKLSTPSSAGDIINRLAIVEDIGVVERVISESRTYYAHQVVKAEDKADLEARVASIVAATQPGEFPKSLRANPLESTVNDLLKRVEELENRLRLQTSSPTPAATKDRERAPENGQGA